jgi:hypothetical protein
MARKEQGAAEQVLLTALAAGASVENAARKAELSERTVYRRLADPKFQERLKRQRADIAQRVANASTSAALASIKTLLDLQQDVSVPAAVRRRAARDLLELSIKYRESAGLEQRVAAIEDLFAFGSSGPPLRKEEEHA